MSNEEDEFTKDFNMRYSAEREKNSKLFIKGFNAGYLLNQHEPELLERVLVSPNENDFYLSGMKCGKHQHEKDKMLEEIKEIRERSKNKERER